MKSIGEKLYDTRLLYVRAGEVITTHGNSRIPIITTKTNPTTAPAKTESPTTSNQDIFLGSNKYEIAKNASLQTWEGKGAFLASDEISFNGDSIRPRTITDIDKDIDAVNKKLESRLGMAVPLDENGRVDQEALIQAIVDRNTQDGMNLGNFSVTEFMGADNDGRMAMLQQMRAENDAAKAEKFEQDLAAAKERDRLEKEKENTTNTGSNGGGFDWGQIASVIGQVVQSFA